MLLIQLENKVRQSAFKQHGKRFGSRHIVFAAGRQVTPYTAKDVSPFHRTKASRYFLMELGHANIISP